MAEHKTIVLITGANSGIGFATAAHLLAQEDKHVIIGCRSDVAGTEALDKLKRLEQPGSVELIILDVSDETSVASAALKVAEEHGRLDVLVNNAGKAVCPPGTPLSQQMAECFAVNAIGPELMVEAFSPLLKRSEGTARIINVTSGDSSISRRFTPHFMTYNQSHIQYRASKAALNMVTANQAVLYGQLGIKVFAVCPGHNISNLSPVTKEEYGAKPASEGAKVLARIINGDRDDEHGKFLHSDGQYTW